MSRNLIRTAKHEEEDPEMEALLKYLRQSRGFDFHGYKRTGLARRIRRRMQIVGISTYTEYGDFLQVHQEEFASLFDAILINLTSFFRDPEAWDAICREVVPAILKHKLPGEPIRIWSAGCASGEEAYTLAMVLAEVIGEGAFRERVKIYATDVDEQVIDHARHASYSRRAVGGVPPELLEKYFELLDGGYSFRKDLRRQIIFGRHDLIQDAPISRVDLISCRNVLMYLNAEAQARILARFHYALNEEGYLFLGRAETIFSHSKLFAPTEIRLRIFVRLQSQREWEHAPLVSITNRDDLPGIESSHRMLYDAAINSSGNAMVVTAADGTIVLANEMARRLLSIKESDIGRPLQDMEFSYRPVEIRSLIETSLAERRSVSAKEVSWPTPGGEACWIDVQVAPLLDETGQPLGSTILFSDVTRFHLLQSELENTNQELETAYAELQSTNEELETTNEELQSTVEELETTNEELQSTNEELETTNEELQSTNEELQTLNDEMRVRTDDLNSANAFLESITSSIGAGMVVVDRDLHVGIWNKRMEDLWGLRQGEVLGKSFFGLDIGLPMEDVRPIVRSCMAKLDEDSAAVVEATNRRGKRFSCSVRCSALRAADGQLQGAILLLEEAGTSPAPGG